MKNRVMSIMVVLALVAGLAVSAAPAFASPPPPDYKPVDVGPVIRGWEATEGRIQGEFRAFTAEELDALEAEAMAAAAATPYFDCATDAKLWLALDNYDGVYFFDYFLLVAETEGSELWVQADLNWPAGDPRDPPMVTCEQALYLLGEFDNNMYPTETSFFGTPDFHDGTYSLLEAWGYVPEGYYKNDDGRQVVLVSNVVDDNYYDPTYPNYIAGFYSPSFEAYFDRNIMNIDSYDWANRVGPDGTRPYLYEGVFAHEYQHLLHDDYDPGEVELVNEGLAMFAEFLTGYVEGNDAYSTFEALPENSLPVWGDQGGREIVADYGLVFLFQMFLYEKYGQDFIQYEFHNLDHGIASINSTLDAFNIRKTFGDLYHDLSVAVLIDDKQANYRYGFELLDVGIDIGTPEEPNLDAFDNPDNEVYNVGAPPWGADYIWVDGDPKDLAKLTFNGVDYTTFPTAWTTNGDMLFSGTGDLLDNWAIFETTGGGVLSIDTLWDLEDYWDFAFVQVSTDGGYTWTSLVDNEGYSTDEYDPNAHPKVVDNVPGLTSFVEGFVTLSYDLSAYAGQDILVAFRLVTDWATHYAGWWIDAVYMDGVEIFDGSDASVFMDITEILPINNNFTVTFVSIKEKAKGSDYQIHTMKLSDFGQEGYFELNRVLKWGDAAVMIVTFDAPDGFEGYADYTYDFTFTNAGPKK